MKLLLWDIIFLCLAIRPSFTELVTFMFMLIILFNLWSIFLLLFYFLNHLPGLKIEVLNSLIFLLFCVFMLLRGIHTQESSLKFFVSIFALGCFPTCFLTVFQLAYLLAPFLFRHLSFINQLNIVEGAFTYHFTLYNNNNYHKFP